MAASTTEIINRQILKWERNRRRSGLVVAAPRVQQPVITISSAYGSYGQKIGEMVADSLGFDLFDRELVEEIATSASIREKTVQSLDDRVRDWITEHISGLFEQEVFTSSDFLRHLSRVVLAIGKHGQAVIVGRGSQFILSPGATLRVRTTADIKERIANVARDDGTGTDVARAEVLRRDAERAAFCRFHFNRDVTDPRHYDLVINTASGPLRRHADLVTYAFLMRFGRQASEVVAGEPTDRQAAPPPMEALE